MQAYLTAVTGAMAGTPLPLSGSVTIGREDGNVLTIADPLLSRRHAVVSLMQGAWHVEDLGSTNGSLLNGNRLGTGPVPLAVGDTLQFGSQIFRFVQDPDPAFTPRAQAAAAPLLEAMGQSTQMMPAYPVHPGQPTPSAPSPHAGTSISVQGRGSWLLWVFLIVVALGPCGFMCLGLTLLVILPYAMFTSGLAMAAIGLSDYRRFSPYPQYYDIARKRMAVGVCGVALALAGGIWSAIDLMDRRAYAESQKQLRRNAEFPGSERTFAPPTGRY